MITLYSLRGPGTLPSDSPFCFKMENYLKLTNLKAYAARMHQELFGKPPSA